MTATFSQRREEIIGDQPLITEVISRWPALFHERQDTNERRRTAAVLGLPHYISGEDPSDVIRMCDAHNEHLDEAMKGMQVGLLIGYEHAQQDAFPSEIFNVAVVVEETIVLHDLKDVTCGFAMLMGIIYILSES
ncbi:uncharacterized protein LOC143316056 [Chaetodon auriga]|uniref:uncharacterized protein LOC143316056 n=1 Tax=Chaetodon auriga TaxID=39042 RepID=UPI004032C310